MITVEYISNNSGGDWWLRDEDWVALEKAGWKVRWEKRIRGALAREASFKCETPDEAIRSFEEATGQDASAQGCDCCGRPHTFSYTDSGDVYHEAKTKVVTSMAGWT